MIDLHSHILPEMDDGSSCVEESVSLLNMLAEQGVETVVATPHFYATKDTPERFLCRRAESAARLNWGAEQGPQLLLGAEVAYFEGMIGSRELEKLQIGDTGLLLLEMPFVPWTDRMVEAVCSFPERLGVQAVLAHVNRYCARNQMKKYADVLLSQGVLFQCNPEGLLEGWDRRWLLKMLSQGNIHFLGSDTHNLTGRPPKLDAVAEVICRKLGRETMEDLNARARELLGLDAEI